MKSKKELEKQFKAHNESNEKLKEDFKVLFQTPVGKKALVTIKNMCGYNTSSLVVGENKEVLVNNVLAAEGARLVWCKFRNFIHKDILKEVENRSE